MPADQYLSVFLLGLTLVAVVATVRLIHFAWLNRQLRDALRRHPDEVAGLAAKLRYWRWTYPLFALALVAEGAAFALIGASPAEGVQHSTMRIALVTAMTGATLLLYVLLASRRRKQGPPAEVRS